MTAAENAIAQGALVLIKALLASPEVQAFLRQAMEVGEDALIDAAPGVSGMLVRLACAIAPHDVESRGFKKDGPG